MLVWFIIPFICFWSFAMPESEVSFQNALYVSSVVVITPLIIESLLMCCTTVMFLKTTLAMWKKAL